MRRQQLVERWIATRAQFSDRVTQAGQEAGQNEQGVGVDAALDEIRPDLLDGCNQLLKLFITMNKVRNKAADGLGSCEDVSLDTVALYAHKYLRKSGNVA